MAPEIEIEYCVPCGLLEEAQNVQEAFLSEYGQDLDGARLTTGDHGVFKVFVDGELIFDSDEEDGLDVDLMKDRFEERTSVGA